MIEQITWALAGQILASVIMGALIGGGLALAGVSLFKKSLSRRELRLRRDELRQRAFAPHIGPPWDPHLRGEDCDDEIHEDFEHMRVVREATP